MYIYIYIGLRILSRYCSCQDSEFRSAMETSSVEKKTVKKPNYIYIHICIILHTIVTGCIVKHLKRLLVFH